MPLVKSTPSDSPAPLELAITSAYFGGGGGVRAVHIPPPPTTTTKGERKSTSLFEYRPVNIWWPAIDELPKRDGGGHCLLICYWICTDEISLERCFFYLNVANLNLFLKIHSEI